MIAHNSLYRYLVGDFGSIDEIRDYEEIEKFLAQNYEAVFETSLDSDEIAEELVRRAIVPDTLMNMNLDDAERAFSIAWDILQQRSYR